MSGPQLIYSTESPEVYAAVTEHVAEVQSGNEALHAFLHDVSDTFPAPAGMHRTFSVQEMLAIGIIRAAGDLPVDGWEFETEGGGRWVPDASTDVGAYWQRRIDDLPALNFQVFDNASIGLPQTLTLADPVTGAADVFPVSLQFSPYQTLTFATTSHRHVKPLMDYAFNSGALLDRGWVEMPRSIYYAYIERDEARVEYEAEMAQAASADITDGGGE